MTKKIKGPVAFLSAFAMVMAMLLYFPGGMFSTCFVLKASAEGITLTEPQKDDNGVYQIGTAGELYWFAACVNGTTDGVTRNTAANAVLTADIVVNENVLNADGTPNGTDFTSWTPIGTSINYSYIGTFEGKNHTISGLYFNDSSTDFVGLFGSVEGGSVSNVGVVDSYFRGYNGVGGVCGANNGTITNCYNTGNVSGSRGVGGVCGANNNPAKITNCYNTGIVSATDNDAEVGGVCGYNQGAITDCYYLENCNAQDTTFDCTEGTIKTAAQFASGEVAYLLQSGQTAVNGTIPEVWGQTLTGENKQDYPVLGGKKVLTNSDQSDFVNDIIIYGQNAALDGTIDFNIYVAADDNYEWSAKIDGAEVTKPAKDENGLYKFTCEVAAKDMAKNIEFYINDDVKATVSVSDYLTELKNSEDEDTPLANLVTAMETYGTAASEFFSTNGKVAEVNSVTAENLSGYTFTKNDAPEGISYYGSSLLLKSETTVRHYFKLANGKSIGDFAFTVDANTVTPVEKQGYYYIDIENISADKLGTGFTVSINGEDVITNYSALSYVYKVLDSDSTDDNLKNLVKTLYLYNQKALAYNAA